MLIDKIFIKFKNKKQTIRQWSIELNIPANRILARYNKSWPVSKILSQDKILEKKSIYVIFHGKKISLEKLADKYGINYNTLYLRYKRGATGKDLINKESLPNAKSTIFLEYKGKKLSLMEWSKKLGIKRSTLLDRYHKGLPVEKILQVIKTRNKSQPSVLFLEHNGQKLSLKDWSEKIGININTLYSRYRKGLPTEDILRTDKLPTSKSQNS